MSGEEIVLALLALIGLSKKKPVQVQAPPSVTEPTEQPKPPSPTPPIAHVPKPEPIPRSPKPPEKPIALPVPKKPVKVTIPRVTTVVVNGKTVMPRGGPQPYGGNAQYVVDEPLSPNGTRVRIVLAKPMPYDADIYAVTASGKKIPVGVIHSGETTKEFTIPPEAISIRGWCRGFSTTVLIKAKTDIASIVFCGV